MKSKLIPEIELMITKYQNLVDTDSVKYASAIRRHTHHTFDEGVSRGFNLGMLAAFEQLANWLHNLPGE